MDRQVFQRKMDYMLKTGNNVLSSDEQQEIMVKSIEKLDAKKRMPMRGFHNTVIVIEELAELAQELSKALREKGDINAILEELADVSIGVDYVKEIFDITDKELDYARSIKMMELNNKLITNSESYS